MMSLNRLHKALLFIFPILSLLLADAPAWSINPAEFQYNGSVTSKVYIDGDEVGSTSDLVAAFVDGEVRGVINGLGLPPFLGGGYSFNIMIFSNDAGGETVSFQYYDSANDEVIELDETLVFTSDMVVGNATAPFELNGTAPTGGGDTGGDDGGTTESCGDQTTWSVNPASFQYNGSVTSKVYIDDIEVGSTEDMVAAFVGDEVRGVVNGLALPPFLGGGYSFNIMIYSNQGSGEEITFKYFAAGSGEVICLNESLEFVSDMVVGNAVSPFVFTGSSSTVSGSGRVLYCEDEVPDNWVADCSDPEPDCATNDTDDCEVCGGGNNNQDCDGICFGDAVVDNCGE